MYVCLCVRLFRFYLLSYFKNVYYHMSRRILMPHIVNSKTKVPMKIHRLNNRIDVKLACLRIGHTKLTHKH